MFPFYFLSSPFFHVSPLLLLMFPPFFMFPLTGSQTAVRLGCYKDTNTNRDMGPGWKSSQMTEELCFTKCKLRNTLYAGLQAGDWCHCSDTFGRHGSGNEADCHRPCWGNQAQSCGGPWLNEVYYIGKSSFDVGFLLHFE